MTAAFNFASIPVMGAARTHYFKNQFPRPSKRQCSPPRPQSDVMLPTGNFTQHLLLRLFLCTMKRRLGPAMLQFLAARSPFSFS